MSLVAENFTAPLDSGQGLFLDNCFSDIPSVVLLLNVWKLSQNRFTSQGLSLDTFFSDIPSFVLPLNGKKLSRNCLYKKFSNSRDNSSRKKMFVLQFIIKLNWGKIVRTTIVFEKNFESQSYGQICSAQFFP